MAIILDIETAALDDIAIEPVEAAKNLRDPEKIAADIAKKQADQIERAALYPWSCRVVCLGYIDVQGVMHTHLCRAEADERAALTAFWAAVQEQDSRFVRPIIGFNHRAFDLPVLMARSLLLGVPHPALNLDRYRTPHIDLMDRLTWFGAIPARSLKWFARRFGIAVDDATGGGDIAALVAAGDYEAVCAHNESDLRLTRALAERAGFVRGMKAVA